MKIKKKKPIKPRIVRNAKGQIVKGSGGREKGVKNKDTKIFVSLKTSFLDAFNDERIGGTEGLIKWVSEHSSRRKVFYGWIVRMLPRTVDMGIEPDSALQTLLDKYKDLNASDLREKAAKLAEEVSRTCGTQSRPK